MEWRIFFPLQEANSVDIWSLLDLGRAAKFFLSSEERRDVYVSCTESVGLKVRGESKLFEIKVRGQKYPCGAEQWSKLVQRRIKVGTDRELIQQAFREELLLIQRDRDSLKSVDEALSIPWANRLLPVSKRVTKGTIQGVSVEQSDLELSGELFCAHAKWRTICFESHSLHKVEEMLQHKVKRSEVGIADYLRAVPDSSVQGYPAFIMKPS